MGGRARLFTTAPHMEHPSPRGCRCWLLSLTPVPSSESLLLAAEMSGKLRPPASPLPFGGNRLCEASYAPELPLGPGRAALLPSTFPAVSESPPSVNPCTRISLRFCFSGPTPTLSFAFSLYKIMGLKGPSTTSLALRFPAVSTTLEALQAAMTFHCDDHLTRAWEGLGWAVCVDATPLSILSAS